MNPGEERLTSLSSILATPSAAASEAADISNSKILFQLIGGGEESCLNESFDDIIRPSSRLEHGHRDVLALDNFMDFVSIRCKYCPDFVCNNKNVLLQHMQQRHSASLPAAGE